MSRKKNRSKEHRKRMAARRLAGPPNSGDEPKMSAVILDLAEPLLKKYGDNPKRSQSIIALTIAAWNKAVLPAAMQEDFQKSVVGAVAPPGKMAEGIEVVTYITNLIAERRRKYYPDLQKYIVNFDFDESEGEFRLNVASALIPTDSWTTDAGS